MIIFNNDTVNIFKLSISDNRKVVAPETAYFFMELVNDMTKQVKVFYASQAGGHRPRFIVLRVDEPGTVNLVEQGFYTYKLWETNDNGLTLSTYESTLTDDDLVHKGKLYYNDTANTEVSYTQYTPTDNTNTLNNNTVYLTI